MSSMRCSAAAFRALWALSELQPATFCPLICRTWSPKRRPPKAAGEFACTSWTNTPYRKRKWHMKDNNTSTKHYLLVMIRMTHLLRMRVCCPKTYYQLTYIPITHSKQWNMTLIMTLRKCLMQRALLTLSISESESDLSFLVFADDDLPKTWVNLCPPDTHVCTSHGPHHATHWTCHCHLLPSKRKFVFILICVSALFTYYTTWKVNCGPCKWSNAVLSNQWVL